MDSGINLPTVKRENQSFQDFVKETLANMFEKNMLDDDEIARLQDKDYCKATFGIEYPLLIIDEEKIRDKKGHLRYWKGVKFNNGRFYACKEWWQDKFEEYEKRMAEWIRKINNSQK